MNKLKNGNERNDKNKQNTKLIHYKYDFIDSTLFFLLISRLGHDFT